MVTVKPATVAVTGVSVNPTTMTLEMGKTVTGTITATVAPSGATNKSVTWTSSNTSVATVDASGKVTAKSAGNATITVKTADGNKTATCMVTVREQAPVTVHVTGVTIDPGILTLKLIEGETVTGMLTATVIPSNASDKMVTWISSDSSIARVNGSGKVTAVSAGEATITVRTLDGSKTAVSRVIVLEKDEPEEKPDNRPVHTIKYVLNGGINSPDNPDSYREGDKIRFLDPTRTGYDFAGWYATKKLTGNTINSTEFQSVDLTLYASWNKAVYRIVYNYGYDDPSTVNNPADYTISSAFTLKKPGRTGYDFSGWYDEKGNLISRIKKGSTGNLSLTAGWNEHTYNVRFSANGGTGVMETVNGVPYSKAIKLPANVYERTGYEFLGWTLNKSGKGTLYEDESSISRLTAKNKATVTLYAKWNAIQYTISYKNMYDGIMPSSYPVSHTYAKAVNLKNPRRTGYSFAGWYDNAGLSGKKLTRIPAKIPGEVTLYAKWNPIQYTIKFNAGGGKGSMKPIKGISYDSEVILTENAFSMKGKSFAGWALNKKGPVEYVDGSRVRNLRSTKGTITLYAVWQ